MGLLALIGLPALAAAQYNTAEISGVVTDQQGGVLPGVSVTAFHVAAGTTTVRTTDEQGRYFLPSLQVGIYDLIAELSGFKRFEQRGLTLVVGQRAEIPVTLQVGALSDLITVTAEAPLLQTANAEIATVLDNRQVAALPLNGRQLLELAQLTDGVAIPPGGTRGGALGQTGQLPNIYGQRGGHNIYLLDGVKVTDEYFNNLVVSPPVDGVEAFRIQKTMYPPEFGGKSSALINVVTKSGGNSVHGSALEFVRNNHFDAHNYFDDPTKPVPTLNQHQFGVNVGGPLKRDRTFFFFSYEGQRLTRALTQTFSVPTAALRSGDFSSLSTPICDPLTRTASGCSAFEGNRIPPYRLDPIAVALLAQVPLPTASGTVQNLLSNANETTPMNQFVMKVDHRVAANDTLSGRFTSYRIDDVQPFGTTSLSEALVSGFGRTVTTHTENLGLSYTHAFQSRWLNELRFGYLRVNGGQESPNQGVDFAAQTGLQGVTTVPADMGYPQVSFGGLFSAIGDPPAFVSRDNTSYEVYDNVMFDGGSHHLKFGGYLFRLEFNPVNPTNARGNFTFNGQWSGNALADFLLGYPSSSQVGIGRADEHGRTTWFHVYGQDDWKISPSFTVNYGLRYEINSQMTDIDNRLAAIDIPNNRFVIASDSNGTLSSSATPPLLAQIPIPYVSSQQAGWTPGLLRPSYLRFAPRVGAVWALDRDQKTILNAAFGVFLNQWAYSVQQALAQTLPFFFSKTVTAAADALQPTQQTATVLLSTANGTIGGNTMNWNFQTEYAKNYSVSLQRQLTANTAFDIMFLRSAIVGADSSTVLNVPTPGPGAIGPRRPIPQLANVTTIRWDGYSIYNGVTLHVGQRLSKGLAFNASYTLSEAIDDASDPGGTAAEANLPQDVRNMAAERADSSFDHRHRLVGNVTYAVPGMSGDGFGARLTRDWQVNGIVTLVSGSPFTVNIGTDRANIGAGPAQRPDQTCDPNVGGAQTAAQWFNTSCFALQPQFTFGDAPRNSVLGPGYADVDLGVQKDLPLGSRAHLQLRWEVFDLLNRVNFDLPNRTAFTPNFGRIFSAEPARQMQFGAKLLF
jgi:hypothetical protein